MNSYTTVIEFMADEPGDWFFHCHLLYHMMSGMARMVKYEGFTPDPATQAVRDEIHEEASPVFFYGHADLLSNMTQGDLTVSSLLHIFSLEWEAGWDGVEGTDTREQWSYQAGLSYTFTQSFSATALWDSGHGVGAGITIRF